MPPLCRHTVKGVGISAVPLLPLPIPLLVPQVPPQSLQVAVVARRQHSHVDDGQSPFRQTVIMGDLAVLVL